MFGEAPFASSPFSASYYPQVEPWVNVIDSQSVVWSNVPDAQSVTWSNVNNSQTVVWNVVQNNISSG